jgi:hypothetical protein
MSALALLTNSRLKVARACQRRHHLMFGLGIRPVAEPEALRFGTLIHKGLEAWWNGAKQGLAGDALLLAMSAALAGDEIEPFERVRAEEMLRGYHYRWQDTLQHYEVLAVEVQFRTPLVNPQTGRSSRIWELGGKMDAIVRDLRDGQVLLVEHKTSSEDLSDGSDYWRRLRMDGQVSIYYEGARSLGHDVAGCLYDVLKKPTLRPLKATPPEDRKFKKDGTLYAAQRETDETPDEYRRRIVEAIAEAPDKFYRRGDVVRLEAEMAEALWDIWQTAQQIHQADASQRYPRNPDACSSFGRACPFFDLCSGLASLDDRTRFTKVANLHPELALDAAAVG